jgi:hypothetical protein
VNQRLRQTDSLEHSLGEFLQALVAMRRKPYEIDQGRNAVAQHIGRHAREASMKSQKLRGRKPLIESEIFGEETNFPAHFNAPGGSAQHKSFAAARFDKSEKHFDRGAFPGAVRTQEAENFSPADR